MLFLKNQDARNKPSSLTVQNSLKLLIGHTAIENKIPTQQHILTPATKFSVVGVPDLGQKQLLMKVKIQRRFIHPAASKGDQAACAHTTRAPAPPSSKGGSGVSGLWS